MRGAFASDSTILALGNAFGNTPEVDILLSEMMDVYWEVPLISTTRRASIQCFPLS